mmetsp:Transcript_15546/g.23402  ORF Transcript_15546/g.23402 Transcript_15546/m.23402 type:complete len:171 (-) Transcript_15546:2987-3499(-)
MIKRTYKYVVDHQGFLYLKDDPRRTVATAYRDKKFLDELYRGLRRRKNGLWIQHCAGESNVVALDVQLDRDDLIVVFNSLDKNKDGQYVLTFAGTMNETFSPNYLRFCPKSYMFFHRLTERNEQRYGPYGLLSSHIVHNISPYLSSTNSSIDDAISLIWEEEKHILLPLT